MENKIFSKIYSSIKELKREYEKQFSIVETFKIGEEIGIWKSGKYDEKEFWMGVNVELEHGSKGAWNITNDDPIMTAKIALAHLDELPDYYTRLKKMEELAE